MASRLVRQGWRADVELTRGHGDATTLARKAVDEGYDAVLAAGGDGTVNEAACALCDTNVPLGIIPCGSGNGLARHLDIPIDVSESVSVILKDHPAYIDYALLNGSHRFFCTCGVGFDASVSDRFARQRTRGLSTYIKSVISEFREFEPAEYTVSAGGEVVTERAFLIAVCNASQYGNNAYIAPGATIDDGLLDITVVHAAGPLRTAFVGFDLMVGNLNKNTLISHLQVPQTVIGRTAPGPIHIDGEPMHLEGALSIECRHRGLRVFTPVRRHRFVPFVTPACGFLRDSRLAVKHMLGLR